MCMYVCICICVGHRCTDSFFAYAEVCVNIRVTYVYIYISPLSCPRVLIRPGQFDTHIHITLPDVLARYNILKVHASKIKLAPGNTPVIITYTSLHTCTHSLSHETLSFVHVLYLYLILFVLFLCTEVDLATIARVTPGLSGLCGTCTHTYMHTYM